jgi:hypothetical protein
MIINFYQTIGNEAKYKSILILQNPQSQKVLYSFHATAFSRLRMSKSDFGIGKTLGKVSILQSLSSLAI